MGNDFKEYYEQKKINILKKIKPLLQDFCGITKEQYDYELEFNADYPQSSPRETLKIANTKIGCTGNSVSAVVEEAIGWVIINYYKREVSKSAITRFWRKK